MAVQHFQSSIQSQGIFPFQEISRKSVHQSVEGGVKAFFAGMEMVEVVGRAGFGFPNFPESKKVFQVVYFKIKEEYKRYQPLLNGLIAIGQPDKGSVEYYGELDTFTIKYYQSDEQEAVSFLSKIFSVLGDEIRFKDILKRVIENQERFAREGQLLNTELFASI